MPDTIAYDLKENRLLIGAGYIERVPPAVWNYEISGKHVLRQWFSYRQKNRDRPLMGDKRPPSKLNSIMPDHWLAEYTTDLIDLVNVLSLLVELEPLQANLLDRICGGCLLSRTELADAGALERPQKRKSKRIARGQKSLLDDLE